MEVRVVCGIFGADDLGETGQVSGKQGLFPEMGSSLPPERLGTERSGSRQPLYSRVARWEQT